MKSYTNSNPEFSETIEIVETTDPVHADLVNKATVQLLQDILVLLKRLDAHSAADNPHGITPESISAVPLSAIGAANGIAALDENGLIPSANLPSYVDDVLEYASANAFPDSGESGKIYLAVDTGIIYRWSGSKYAEISASLALGETASTAYPGNKGKAAYDHISNGDVHITADERTKLSGVASGATKNTASSTVPKAAGTAVAGTEKNFARGDHVHPAQTDITGNAGTATKLATARNINGISFDGSANRINFGVCSTSAATAAKTVACTGFALMTGAEITVFFNTTNTAANPTLNVNNTGAKPIYYRGAAISAGYLAANRIYTFRYTGSAYSLVGDINTNTTYSNFVKSGSGAKAGLVPAPSTTAGTSKYLREDGTWQTPPNTTYSNATTTTAGLMSAADKTKLNNLGVVTYGGSVANNTVELTVPAGKTKCLIIASRSVSTGTSCGAAILTVSTGMTANTSTWTTIISGPQIVVQYQIKAANKLTLGGSFADYTAIFFA